MLRTVGYLPYADALMKEVLLAVLHLAVMTARLCGPGGVRAVIAENLLLKQQLIVLRHHRRRSPKLTRIDRLLCGWWSLFLRSGRIQKITVAFRPRSRSACAVLACRSILKRVASDRQVGQEREHCAPSPLNGIVYARRAVC